MKIPFVGDAYATRSPNLNAQTCINLYPVTDFFGDDPTQGVKNGKVPVALYRTPGLQEFTTNIHGHALARQGGLHELNGTLYAVIDNKLIIVDRFGNETDVGTLNTSTGPVCIIAGTISLLILDGHSGYCYDFVTDTFTDLSTVSTFIHTATQGTYIDGYAVIVKPQSTSFYINHDHNNFLVWDVHDNAATTTTAGYLVAVQQFRQELFMFTRYCTEIWYDSGPSVESNFPLRRKQGLLITKGCAAQYSICVVDGAIYWLGRDLSGYAQVLRVEQYTAVPVSNDAIETLITQYGDISDAFAYTYKEFGHVFYVLTFPAANKTWVYDITTNFWHQRTSTIDGSYEKQGRHRGNSYAFLDGKHILGDVYSGRLMQMKSGFYDEMGTRMFLERTTQHVFDSLLQFSIKSLKIDIQGGTGLATGQGSNPQLMLQYSKDGGHTWSNELWQSMGAAGQYTKYIQYNRLGLFRISATFRLRYSEPTDFVILGAEASGDVGLH